VTLDILLVEALVVETQEALHLQLLVALVEVVMVVLVEPQEQRVMQELRIQVVALVVVEMMLVDTLAEKVLL
jgi:hypothetical protein